MPLFYPSLEYKYPKFYAKCFIIHISIFSNSLVSKLSIVNRLVKSKLNVFHAHMQFTKFNNFLLTWNLVSVGPNKA